MLQRSSLPPAQIRFLVLVMRGSAFIWLGRTPLLSTMAYALPAAAKNGDPFATTLLGQMDALSEPLARRLGV